MDVFNSLGNFAIAATSEKRKGPSRARPAAADHRYMTTRIANYVAANPGCTAYQIARDLNAAEKSVHMTLSHLSKKGVLRYRKMLAKPGTHARRDFVYHYWRVE